MKNRKSTFFNYPGMLFVFVFLPIVSHGAVAADDSGRESVTAQGLRSQGGVTADAGRSTDTYESLSISGERVKPTRAASPQKQFRSSAPVAAVANTDFWFYTADIELFSDRDRDGYYAGIDLLFDADTYYDIADVYAVVYLSYEYGPWNEYAETETFTIFGASSNDEYVVETDLVQGYPTGNYDMLIELYDAYDNAFVASFGPEDSSELAILPLEDANRDAPNPVTTQIVVSSGGGGAFGWFLLLGLLGSAIARKS